MKKYSSVEEWKTYLCAEEWVSVNEHNKLPTDASTKIVINVDDPDDPGCFAFRNELGQWLNAETQQYIRNVTHWRELLPRPKK